MGPYPADPDSNLYTWAELVDLFRRICAGPSGASGTGGLPPSSLLNPSSPPPTLPNPSLPPWLGRRVHLPSVMSLFIIPPLTLLPVDGNAYLVVLDGFITGQSNVPGMYIPRLDRLDHAASIIRAAWPPPTVLIQGHTDTVGSEPFNEALGLRRAQAVRDALLARRLDARQLVVSSAGGSSSVADYDTSDEYARNRRVEIFWTTERFRPPLSP